jgi:hypothetical protein
MNSYIYALLILHFVSSMYAADDNVFFSLPNKHIEKDKIAVADGLNRRKRKINKESSELILQETPIVTAPDQCEDMGGSGEKNSRQNNSIPEVVRLIKIGGIVSGLVPLGKYHNNMMYAEINDFLTCVMAQLKRQGYIQEEPVTVSVAEDAQSADATTDQLSPVVETHDVGPYHDYPKRIKISDLLNDN